MGRILSARFAIKPDFFLKPAAASPANGVSGGLDFHTLDATPEPVPGNYSA